MKITELREKLRNKEKEELQTLIVEMYKLIPKSVKEEKEIDALIDHPTQFKTQAKKTQTALTSVDFQMLKSEIEQFIEHAYAQYYIAPNRIVPKKERSNWRTLAKRLVEQLMVIASKPAHQKDCAVLLEKLYVLFCYASGHYVFVSEEPFRTLKIPQEAFLKRVIVLKKQVDEPKHWIRDVLQLIVEHDVDRETLTSTLLITLLEELSNTPLKEQAIEICKQLVEERKEQLAQLQSPKKSRYYFASSKEYAERRKLNSLVEMIFILQSTLGEKEKAVQYYQQHYVEDDQEIKLYVLLRKIKGYQRPEDWLQAYEHAVEDGVKPRKDLTREYNYIKEHDDFHFNPFRHW